MICKCGRQQTRNPFFVDDLFFFDHRCTSLVNQLAMQSRILMHHPRRDMQREAGESNV